MPSLFTFVIGATLLGIGAVAQTPQPAPQVDVVSVKPNASNTPPYPSINVQQGGRLTATNVSVRYLLMDAYDITLPYELEGNPGWLDTERFDILAKADREITSPPRTAPVGATRVPPRPHHLLLRQILADRFKLMVHRETRELPVYALVLAREDKRLGPKLRPATADCVAMRASAPPGSTPPPPLNDPAVCGMRMTPGRWAIGDMPLDMLASMLVGNLQRLILDRTGLEGRFVMDLSFTAQVTPRPVDAANPAASADAAPDIFTALQEQLGLKLESTRATREVLVIDRVERPGPD